MNRGWSDTDLARRVAQEFPDGACVNLGIGLPTKVAEHIPPDREVLIHSENGIIGMGPDPAPGTEDPDVVNAGKKFVTLIAGAAIVHQADSFSLIRGGRLFATVLGALQVAANGDLANWRVANSEVGGVGGAMDLAAGAQRVFVMMRHCDKSGHPKLVKKCTFPLTAPNCVTTVYSELGVFDCKRNAFLCKELAPGVTKKEAMEATEGTLEFLF